MMDMLNLTYPGCTGVYLAEAGHIIALETMVNFNKPQSKQFKDAIKNAHHVWI